MNSLAANIVTTKIADLILEKKIVNAAIFPKNYSTEKNLSTI